jgi:hypothetical protein
MRGTLLGVLALSLGAVPADAARGAVAVAWVDVSGLPAAVGEGARRELGTALARAGVAVHMRSAVAGEAIAEDEVVLVVVPGRAPVDGRGGPVLGSVPRDGQPPRTAWVHLPTVLAVLGLPGGGGPTTPLEQRDMALAVGRVAAHELVHVLAPEAPHAATGLMSSRLGRAALTAPAARLDVRTLQAVPGNPVDSPAEGGPHWPQR